MAQIYFDRRSQNIKDKFLSFDFLLVFLILALGIISIFAMYSSEQWKFGYYTQNHLYRFLVFFSVFIFVSFLSTSFWYKSSYIFYFLVLLLLIFVHYDPFFRIFFFFEQFFDKMFISNIKIVEEVSLLANRLCC